MKNVMTTLAALLLCAGTLTAHADGLNLLDLIAAEEADANKQTPAANKPEPLFAERMVTQPAAVNPIEKQPKVQIVEKVVEKPVLVKQTVTNVVEKVVEKPVLVEKTVTNVVEKVVEKPVLVKQTVTNVVEKVVEKQGDEKKKLTGRPAKISSATTYYDRKHGFVIFDKNVHVDDEQYQLHADKAYVFLGATNDLRRLVAIGHVAMTNEAKRAYGAKASYYRQNGMVVLYGGDGVVAEVRDESKSQDQAVRGSKIKFWIDSEQVEVMNADITVQAIGAEGVKDMLPVQ